MNKSLQHLHVLITIVSAFVSATNVRAQGTAVTYQGVLNLNGNLYTGAAEMQFTLWDTASGGAGPVASNSPTAVPVTVANGLFTATLDFGAATFSGADRWMEIQVRTDLGAFTTLSPRQKLTAAPYSIRAREAAGVPSGAITTAMIATGAVTDTQLSAITAAGKVANSATTAASANAPGAIVTRDASGHFAASGVSIQAGTAIAALSVVGTRDGFFGTPLGLFQNLNNAGNSGPALRVVNEGGNSVDGALSVSAAGTGDIAVFGNVSAFVSRLDTSGAWSARAFDASERLRAGPGHELTGYLSSIVGGFNNTNRALYSFIGAGSQNSIATNANHHAVGGGANNSIGTNSSYGVIGGGRDNSIGSNTTYAVVPGGRNNTANGAYSFAAGRFAKADHTGAFVWSDSTAVEFPSTLANQFSVRAGGGVRFVTSGAGMTLDGQPVLAGTVGTTSLADTSVTTAKLADNSVTLLKLADGAVTGAKIVDGTILPAELSLSAFDLSFWRAGGNAGTTAGTHFLGTADNQALELKVNNQRALRLEPTSGSPNVIGGSSANSVSNTVVGASIAGGGTAGSPNVVLAGYGTVGGGFDNIVGGSTATIGGGSDNSADGITATVSGGRNNNASGNTATIGGGSGNIASSLFSTVGGGAGNTNAGIRATISGGWNNLANNFSSAVGGGETNRATGSFATVPGGENNTAAGAHSLAAGQRAKANHSGSFVWSDTQSSDFASTTANQFRVRAAGGMEILGGSGQPALHYSGARTGGFGSPVGLAENTNTVGQSAPALRVVNKGGDSIDGALSVSIEGTGNIAGFGNSSAFVSQLSANGTWTALAFNPTSDRNAKENFTPVNPREVLDKVAALPLARWNYQAAPGLEHIGPVAQDFHAAFGLNGGDDKHIATVDADGVALAAIQGLNQKVDQKDAEITELKRELEKLKLLVDKLVNANR
jgi:hypothetical protein